MTKENYHWNFDVNNYSAQNGPRQTKVSEMLQEVRKMRDEAVSNKKKV